MTHVSGSGWLSPSLDSATLAINPIEQPLPEVPPPPATSTMLDVHDVLREVLQGCDSSIRSRRLEVSLRLLARNHYISADRERVRQTVDNLLRRAIDSTRPGGQLTVRSSRPADCAFRIEVEERSPWLRKRPASVARNRPAKAATSRRDT